MPIYEYLCDACGHKMEALQRMGAAPLTDCPQCEAADLRKLVSAAAFRLKGDGWYETDFKKDKDKQLNLATPENKADDATAAKAKTETGKDKDSKKGGDPADRSKASKDSAKTRNSAHADRPTAKGAASQVSAKPD